MLLKPVTEQYIYRRKKIQVGVKIDYNRKTISLVEVDGGVKVWAFTDRGIEYMQGWQDILLIMSEAIKHAEARLKAYNDKDFEDFAKLMYEVQQNPKDS